MPEDVNPTPPAAPKPPDKSEELMKWYNLAGKLVDTVMAKVDPEGRLDPEDVVNAWMANFIEKDFASKFDPSVQKPESYVMSGLRNIAVSIKRHKREKVSREELAQRMKGAKGEESPGPIEPTAPEDEAEADARKRAAREFFEDLLKKLKDFKFGYGKDVDIKDEDGSVIGTFKSTAHDMLRLMAMGYEPVRLAEMYGVSLGTIHVVLNKIKTQAKELYPEEVVERYLPDEDGRLNDLMEDMM